jgi:hypothetical protein
MRNQKDLYNKPKKQMEPAPKKKAKTDEPSMGKEKEKHKLRAKDAPTNTKRLSPKQKAIAKKAGDPNRIDGADLKALRNKARKTK